MSHNLTTGRGTEKVDFEGICKHLEGVIKVLSNHKLEDSVIRHRYAEYYVARKLAEKKHDPRILGDRGKETGADIYLENNKKHVEVKSGRYESPKLGRGKAGECIEYVAASFGQGKQIKKKFDYCVFVTFKGMRKKEIFVFKREELADLPKRKWLADHPATNPCLLFYFPRKYSETQIRDTFAKWHKTRRKEDLLPIEIKLNAGQRHYLDNWNKIE